MSKQDILDFFSDINYAYNDSTRLDTLSRMLDELVEPAASPWHRADEPPKEEGKYFVAYRSSVVDGWGYDTAYYTKHLEDKMLMIPVPENSEGWFNWSDYNDCDVLVSLDYWMPIEPPQEDA